MISRQWRGLAKTNCAEAYIEHLRTGTLPALSKISGFIGASILRRTLPDGIEFLVVTEWASFDAIRAFAGTNTEQAVVPPEVHNIKSAPAACTAPHRGAIARDTGSYKATAPLAVVLAPCLATSGTATRPRTIMR